MIENINILIQQLQETDLFASPSKEELAIRQEEYYATPEGKKVKLRLEEEERRRKKREEHKEKALKEYKPYAEQQLKHFCSLLPKNRGTVSYDGLEAVEAQVWYDSPLVRVTYRTTLTFSSHPSIKVTVEFLKEDAKDLMLPYQAFVGTSSRSLKLNEEPGYSQKKMPAATDKTFIEALERLWRLVLRNTEQSVAKTLDKLTQLNNTKREKIAKEIKSFIEVNDFRCNMCRVQYKGSKGLVLTNFQDYQIATLCPFCVRTASGAIDGQ